MEYIEEIEYIDGFKVINKIPKYSQEEEKEVKQDILKKLNKLFSDKKTIDTNVKHIYN